MKILLINGSHRGRESTTVKFAESFLKGVREAFPETPEEKTLVLSEMNLLACEGCMDCLYKGIPCFLEDDLADILEEMERADLVVFSFPVYAFNFPSLLKKLFDRFISLNEFCYVKNGEEYKYRSRMDFTKKHFLMISACGFPSVKNNAEPAKLAFQIMFGENTTEFVIPESTILSVPDFRDQAETVHEKLRLAGEEYARGGFVLNGETVASLETPVIPPRVLVRFVSLAREEQEERNRES